MYNDIGMNIMSKHWNNLFSKLIWAHWSALLTASLSMVWAKLAIMSTWKQSIQEPSLYNCFPIYNYYNNKYSILIWLRAIFINGILNLNPGKGFGVNLTVIEWVCYLSAWVNKFDAQISRSAHLKGWVFTKVSTCNNIVITIYLAQILGRNWSWIT